MIGKLIFLAWTILLVQSRPEERRSPLCPTDWSIHRLVPNADDCNAFYYCNFGELVPRVCPDELHFNPTLQVCDWPWRAGCKPGTSDEVVEPDSSEEEDKPGSSKEEGKPGPSEEESGEGGLPSDDCPSDWSIHLLLPNPDDCYAFYYCNFGYKVPRVCPDGLHFNPTLQVCDWPWRAGCKPGTSEEVVEPDSSEEEDKPGSSKEEGKPGPSEEVVEPDSSEEEGKPGPSEEESGEGGLPSDDCPSDWSIHLLLPNPDDCYAFYYCNFGYKVPRVCPDGLHFNPTLQVCDWPWRAGCKPGTSEEVVEPDSSEEEDKPGSSKEEGKPGPSEEESGEGGPPSGDCPSDWSIHLLLPNPDDCNAFYYCNFGYKVPRVCPDGLHFNPAIQVCDWPRDAGCAV